MISYEDELKILERIMKNDYESYCNWQKLDKNNYKNFIHYLFENYNGMENLIKDSFDEDFFNEQVREYYNNLPKEDYDDYYKDLCDRNRGI